MRDDITLFVVGSFVAASAAKVERLPKPGESLAAQSFILEPGGKGFNLAVACRRLGAVVNGILPIGDDMLSGLAGPALDRAGLSPDMLHRLPGSTGAGIGFIDAKGENCLAVFPGANALLCAKDVQAKAADIADADITLAQFEIGDEPIVAAFALAREAGRMTLLNPSPFRKLDRRLLELTSVLVLNAHEAAALASDLAGATISVFDEHSSLAEVAAFAAQVMALGPAVVVVTLGEGGAFLCRSDRMPLHQPAFPIEAIDTLGAGDAFAAGLAVGIAEGREWTDILSFANACGAILAGKLGVFDAFPNRSAVNAFLSQHI
ncbi:MAG TPA: ribokinase [Stellaceae bacterium]|nr:ribokinase [Stellaceae bacterium]